MALTILEAAKLAANNGEYKKAGVLSSFAESSPLLRAMPVVTIPGNSYAWVRQADLPSVAFRAVNAAFTPSEGHVETRTEALKLVGGEVDVDRALVQQMGPDIRSVHERMKAVALGQSVGAKIMSASIATNPLEFDGIRARYGGLAPTAAANLISMAGALSIKKLDEAIDAVDNVAGRRVLVMSQAMRRNITAFLRTSVSIQTTRDEFGKQVYTYNGLDILEMDENGNTSGASPADTTNQSVYCIALGESGVHLIEGMGGISVRDLGEIPNAPVYRTRIDWAVGLVDESVRCVSRVYGITDVSAVA